jgi:hypothetical protein
MANPRSPRTSSTRSTTYFGTGRGPRTPDLGGAHGTKDVTDALLERLSRRGSDPG